MNFNTKYLSEENIKSIDSLLLQSPHDPPLLEDVWELMNSVWDEIGCDNENPDWDDISKFYSHPIWLLNGLFIEQDELSMQHRNAISGWINTKKFKNILDFGGGFGTLARLIAGNDSNICVDIYEPYPCDYAKSMAKDYPNINFIHTVDKKYDCIVCTDVLEHVSDPLKLCSEIIDNIKTDGYLIIANNFYPVIKCHLPSTFHLRYTFRIFAYKFGLRNKGPCRGSHATIYQKKKDIVLEMNNIGKYEQISRFIYHFLDPLHRIYVRFRDWIR